MRRSYPTVNLSMLAADGTVLTATSEEELARAWAAHVYGPTWSDLTLGRKSVEVAAALREIREALHAHELSLV